ncbi:MAG: hypothetical protein LPJ89_10190 [Hymenobacteraceae bacterium]|nr:hypothetical protein [Hymenobacteraceae bacterium]
MKKLFVTSAFVVCAALLSVSDVAAQQSTSSNTETAAKTEVVTTINKNNVKMYRQPGFEADVIKVLNQSEEVVYLRRLNSTWSIVKSGNEVGYVLNSRVNKIVK